MKNERLIQNFALWMRNMLARLSWSNLWVDFNYSTQKRKKERTTTHWSRERNLNLYHFHLTCPSLTHSPTALWSSAVYRPPLRHRKPTSGLTTPVTNLKRNRSSTLTASSPHPSLLVGDAVSGVQTVAQLKKWHEVVSTCVHIVWYYVLCFSFFQFWLFLIIVCCGYDSHQFLNRNWDFGQDLSLQSGVSRLSRLIVLLLR